MRPRTREPRQARVRLWVTLGNRNVGASPRLRFSNMRAEGRRLPRHFPILTSPIWSCALQLLLLLSVFKLYSQLNLLAANQAGRAYAHAADIVGLEQRLSIFIEPRLQTWASHRAPIESGLGGASLWQSMAYIYAHGHITWLAMMLLWVFLFRRSRFGYMCSLAHVATISAIVARALYPVAPPRFFLAGPPYGMTDVTGVPSSEQMYARFAGFDVFGAMPSVHMLWALITAVGLALGIRHVGGRAACLIFPATIVVAVVITGNHYVLDCLGAAAILGGSMLVLLGCRHFVRPWMPDRAAVRIEPVATDIRALDGPLVLTGFVSVVMLIGGDLTQRLIGALLCLFAYRALRLAQRRVRSGGAMRRGSPNLEWLSGLLLVAGVTFIDADAPALRLCGTAMWAVACMMPLAAGVRLALHEPSASPAPATLAAGA